MNYIYISLILIMNTFMSVQEKPTRLIYVGDPMCSWCYGFAPELDEIQKSYPDLEFKVILGGLRPYGTETMSDLNGFLEHHWEDVAKASGQPFSYEILKDAEFIYDTEPASRAVVVARCMNADIEFEFFKAVQHAFYAENENTTELKTFLGIAKSFDLDENMFAALYESSEVINEVKADFQMSQKMGIRGFPALVLQDNEGYTLISKGYMKAKYINEMIGENL